MKYLVVFSCLLAVIYGLPPEIIEKIKEQVLQNAGQCKTEIGATDDDIAPVKAHEPPTTQNGKCFIACMHKKFGIQDQSGKIDKDATYALIEKMKPLDEELYGKMKQITDTCSAEVTDATDECETAFNLFLCAQKKNKEVGITPLEF